MSTGLNAQILRSTATPSKPRPFMMQPLRFKNARIRRAKRCAIALAALSALGCSERASSDCAATRTCAPEDAAAVNGSSPSGRLLEEGGDCGDCPSESPECNEVNECVECTADEHCGGAATFCVSEQCVACKVFLDCTEASAPSCVGGRCAPCSSSSDCDHIPGAPACNVETGTCVECMPESGAGICQGYSCSRMTNTCTTTLQDSLRTCDPCQADSECGVSRKCVMHEFEGQEVGFFCFFEQGTMGCGDEEPIRQPYSRSVQRTSIDGFTPQNYCLPPESTTCAGILESHDVACARDEECGTDSLDDGYCPSVGEQAGRCSYRCTEDVDCAALRSCVGSPAHCN